MKTDKGGVMDLKRLARRFFGFLKEFFTDMLDHWRLMCLEKKIESLNEELDWFSGETSGKLKELDLYLEARNIVLIRIRAREERHEKVTQHA